MSISKKQSELFKAMSVETRKRLVKLAWSDKTGMKDIEKEFGLTANQLEKFMRHELTEKDYKRWMIRRSKRFNLKSKRAANLKLT